MNVRDRVVHSYKVYSPDVEGGVPSVMKSIIRCLVRYCDNDVVVARLKGGGSTEMAEGVNIHRSMSFGGLWSLPIAPGYPLLLWRKLRQANVLALHVPFPLGDLVAAFALKRTTRLIVHWHSNIVKQRALLPILRPLIRRVLNRADAIVISDASLIQEFSELGPYEAKVSVIPFCVDVAEWNELSEDDRVAIADWKRRHPTLIVAVGRLVTYKGFDVLIESMRKIDAHLVICGEGPCLNDLQKKIKGARLQQRVTLLGRLDFSELRRLIQAADIFVLPSVTPAETFGMVQLEAMACGVPVINTSLSTAVPHVARHGLEGLTTKAGCPEELAVAISKLIDDRPLAMRYGDAGRQRALKDYSTPTFERRVRRVYLSHSVTEADESEPISEAKYERAVT